MGCCVSLWSTKCVESKAKTPPPTLQDVPTLHNILTNGAVRLIKRDWLYDHFVDKGIPLVRRQDLPDKAFAPIEDAVAAIDSDRVAVLSHAWLAPNHPDPEGIRRKDITCFNNHTYKYLF